MISSLATANMAQVIIGVVTIAFAAVVAFGGIRYGLGRLDGKLQAYMTHEAHAPICKGVQDTIFEKISEKDTKHNESEEKILKSLNRIEGYLIKQNGGTL